MAAPQRPVELNRRERLRQTRKFLRLGATPGPCALCGYYSSMPGLLRPFRPSELAEPLRQKVLQHHHPDGRGASDFIIWVCVWCHAEESDAQYDLPPRLRHPRTPEDRALAILAGSARLKKRLGALLQSRGEWEEAEILKILADETGGDA